MRAVGLLLAFGLCAGCQAPAPPPRVREVEPPPAADFVPPEGFTRLRISFTPYLEPEKLVRSHQPLAEYLSAQLRVPVEITPADSYDHVGQLMREGKVDLGSFSPLSYVRARRQDPGMIPVVNFIAEGSATSAGYIVVRAGSGLDSLEALRGRSFAWVDPSSTSGYLFPRALMRQRGISPDAFFSRTAFLGNHEAALLAVHRGEFDATATYQGALPALRRSQGVDPLDFRIVAKTLRSPKDLFCARAGLPDAVVVQIRRALLAVSVRTEQGRRLLGPLQANGFILADEALYDEVREVEEERAPRP
jgi:phosphate/phosphite/phosphonate ABC transporter binding protein